MRISEIITDAISQPGRDEYISDDIHYFIDSPTVYVINDLELRKYMSDDELYYGLLDDDNLVGILKLEYIGIGWQVRLSQIDESYKSQGYGSFMYDYAVMNDNLTLYSDTSQSEGKMGGSRGLWEKLYRQGRFKVGGYNLDTKQYIDLDDYSDISSKIYNQKEDIVWVASPKILRESITEMLVRLNKKNKHRTIVWYGPEIKHE